MKIIQIHIYLLMWSKATESVTNTTVTSGADVNVSCDLDIEMYCYRHKLPDPPMLILTCNGTQDKTCKPQCLVNTNSSMFIRNISSDELGVYYCCVKTSEAQKFCNIPKSYISDSVHGNQTELNDCKQHQTPWIILIFTSVLLNVFLIIAVTGLVKCCLDATRRSKNTSEKPQSTTAAQNTNDPQYAEVDFTKCRSRNTPCLDQTTYSALQLVKTE